MKILFLSDNFPPEVNAPATRTYEHCVEWVKQGADVTVITGFPNFPHGKVYEGYSNRWKQVEWMEGIKVIRVWTYISANKGFYRRTLDYISFSVTAFFAGLFEKTHIIVATSPQFFTALSGRTLAFWKRKPWIMEVRDLWPESIKTVGAMKDNLFIRYFEKEEKWCYQSASRIVVVTDSFKEEIVKKGIPARKIKVIKNGSNTALFQPQPKDPSLLSKLNLEQKKVLGYIGTHGMAHRLDFILDCAKAMKDSHPDFHFLLIGNGAEKEKLLQKVQEEGISNVTMLDSVPKEKVVQYLSLLDAAIINLRKSDLFKTVIPSKIFETAAMEIPILLGVDGEARSIVEQYEAGLFYEPENQPDFIDKVNLLFSGNGEMAKLKEGCAVLARDFDRKKLAAEKLEMIEKTVMYRP